MDDLIGKLQKLKPIELDYVIERSSNNSVKDACKQIGMSPSALYAWDSREELEELALALRLDRHVEVELKLRQALPDAIEVVIDGLKNKRYSEKFKAAVEILDRTLGKPTQKIDQKTEHSGAIEVIVDWDDDVIQESE